MTVQCAAEWKLILQELMPKVRFPGAVVRRAVALRVFEACHIAPSHRRYPHPLWVDSLSLIADLLLGCGVGRYLGCGFGPAFEQEVALRGLQLAVSLAYAFCTFVAYTGRSHQRQFGCNCVPPSAADDELCQRGRQALPRSL